MWDLLLNPKIDVSMASGRWNLPMARTLRYTPIEPEI